MAAVRAGVGRERAHEAIKEHAVAVALAMRERGAEKNDLLDRLLSDARLGGVKRDALEQALARPIELTGAAAEQTRAFVARVEELARGNPAAARYQPEPML